MGRLSPEVIIQKSREGQIEARIRQARIQGANQFLGEVLFPAIESGEKIDQSRLQEMLDDFREEHPGSGADFDVSQVWGKAYELSFMSPSLADRLIAERAFDLFRVPV